MAQIQVFQEGMHWAFDHGIFTLSDDYEVRVHERARDGDQRLTPVFEAEGRQILVPKEAFYRPHPSALAWHRERRFGAFLRGTAKFSLVKKVGAGLKNSYG